MQVLQDPNANKCLHPQGNYEFLINPSALKITGSTNELMSINGETNAMVTAGIYAPLTLGSWYCEYDTWTTTTALATTATWNCMRFLPSEATAKTNGVTDARFYTRTPTIITTYYNIMGSLGTAFYS